MRTINPNPLSFSLGFCFLSVDSLPYETAEGNGGLAVSASATGVFTGDWIPAPSDSEMLGVGVGTCSPPKVLKRNDWVFREGRELVERKQPEKAHAHTQTHNTNESPSAF